MTKERYIFSIVGNACALFAIYYEEEKLICTLLRCIFPFLEIHRLMDKSIILSPLTIIPKGPILWVVVIYAMIYLIN